MAAALRHYACAHELLPPDATSLHACVLTDWSLAVMRGGEIGGAADLAQQGLHTAETAAARPLQDVSILAAALNSLALVHADAGDPACAIPLVEEALTQAVRIGDRHRAALLYNTLVDLHHVGGQEEQAMAQPNVKWTHILVLPDIPICEELCLDVSCGCLAPSASLSA